MAEQFELPVEYKGNEHTFKTVLNVYGHTHKFHVAVDDQTILFEPDEEGNYRAVIEYEKLENHKKVDSELLQAIVNSSSRNYKIIFLVVHQAGIKS